MNDDHQTKADAVGRGAPKDPLTLYVLALMTGAQPVTPSLKTKAKKSPGGQCSKKAIESAKKRKRK